MLYATQYVLNFGSTSSDNCLPNFIYLETLLLAQVVDTGKIFPHRHLRSTYKIRVLYGCKCNQPKVSDIHNGRILLGMCGAVPRTKECAIRESNPGHIDGNDIFYH